MSETYGVMNAVPPPLPPAQRPETPGRWVRAVAVTVAVFLVAGAVAGLIWQQLAPVAQYKVDDQGASLDEEQMTKVFGPDGTFASIGFIAAVVVGGALFWWLRERGPWAVVTVVLGSAIGSGAAWGLGMVIGHDALDPRLDAAKPGDLIAAPLELHAWTALAAWPIGAALVAALLAALNWRRDQETAKPPGPSEQAPWPTT
jgi:hypothetical protein